MPSEADSASYTCSSAFVVEHVCRMPLLYLILHIVLIYTSCVDLMETLVYNIRDRSWAI